MSLDPPLANNRDGEKRRIGVELELSGLELDQITELVQDLLGGQIVKTSRYEARIEKTEIGPIRVEFDARVFREMKVRNFFEEVDEEKFLSKRDKENLEVALAKMAG